MGKKYQDTVETVISATNQASAELRKAEDEAKQLAQRERARQREAQQLAKERESVERDLLTRRLRQSGDGIKADMQQERVAFARKIRLARAHNDQELADRLRMLQRMRRQEVIAEQRRAREVARVRQRERQRDRNRGKAGELAGFFGVQGGSGLIGVGVLAGIGRAARSVADSLKEASEQGMSFEQTMGHVADRMVSATPIIGDFYEASKSFKEWRSGLAEVNAELAKAEEHYKRVKAYADAVDSSGQSSRIRTRDLEAENAAMQAPESERDALRLAREREKAIEDINRKITEQREKDKEFGDRSSWAYRQLIEERSAIYDKFVLKQRALDRKRRDEEAQAEKQRIETRIEAQTEFENLKLRLAGKTLELELQQIKQNFEERVKQAKAAQDEETYYALYMMRAYQEDEARARDARRQRMEELNEQASDVRREISEVTERMQRMSRSDSPGLITANQNRFAAGARQAQERDDRLARSHQEKQLNVMQQTLDSLKQQERDLSELLKKIKESPAILVGGKV